MNPNEPTPDGDAVTDTRSARAAVCAGGFDKLEEHLAQVRRDFLLRQGPFADVPTERPAYVRDVIGTASDPESFVQETRGVRATPPAH